MNQCHIVTQQSSQSVGNQITSRSSMLSFAFGVLGIGMIPAILTFVLDPSAVQRIGLDVMPIPPWIFTVVWLVAYPGMGVATWLVWRKRHEANVCIPIAVFVVGLIQTLSFWLTSSLQMTAVLDAMVLLIAYTVAWVYFQYDKRTVWWLLPWLIWMPLTFAIKIWAIFGGVS